MAPGSLRDLLKVLAVTLTLAVAHAQDCNLAGTVFDPVRARVPNAGVELVNEQSRESRALRADAAGDFLFTLVPPGRYELRVTQPGFAIYSKPALVLAPGESHSVSVKLEMGEVVESIAVTARGVPSDNAILAAGPPRIRVGGNVQAMKLVRQVKPPYPEEARTAGVEGSVVLEAVIGKDGRPEKIRVLRSIGFGLDDQAIQAVSQWRYEPTLLNGEPVEVNTTVVVNFKLAP